MTFGEREELARVAYAAYGDTAGWKNFRGDPMPEWENLGSSIQTCWIMAASAVRNFVLTPPSER